MLFSLPRAALAFIGRHATITYAVSVVLGLALPALAASLRPFIPISIFVFIMLAFARANLPGLKLVFQRPGQIAYVLLVSAVIPPLIVGALIFSPAGQMLDPDIRLAIALMAAAPPLMASPVYAALLGFENSLALTALVLGMITTPITAPVLASLLAGAEVPLSPWVLAQRLALFIGGGMLAGLALRFSVGVNRLSGWKNELDGVGVVMFFLFAIAAMDGVIDATLARPWLIIGLFSLSLLLSTMQFALGYVLLGMLNFNDRFSSAICIGLRNMGLLMTPILAIAPRTTFLYFALAQIPIYLAPLMLRAAKRWLDPAPNPPETA